MGSAKEVLAKMMEMFSEGEMAISMSYRLNDDNEHEFLSMSIHQPYPYDPAWLSFDADNKVAHISNVTKSTLEDEDVLAILGLPSNFGE